MIPPTLREARRVADDTDILTTHLDLPGMGVLPVNAFLLRSAEPVLIDTGVPALSDRFVSELARVFPLEELRWIWLTHNDADHIGALDRVLEHAPNARVITTFLGMGKDNMSSPRLSPDRVWLVRHGQRVSVGDRELVALRPPTFDAPETTCLFDLRTRVLFSADSFGGVLPETAEDARAVAPAALRDGVIAWATIDNPWIHSVDPRDMDRSLGEIAALKPSAILSAHLPPAPGAMLETLSAHVAAARAAPRFAGPDQHDLMASIRAA